MNMMTRIQAENEGTVSKAGSKPFLDKNGEPSDRCGPDLTTARPIEEVIRELGRLRSCFSVEFWGACTASGIDISVMRTSEGEDRLMIGFPCDDQEDLRRPRYDALVALLEKTNWRRQSVIDLANMLGRFADNQPFASIDEAAREFTDAGGRIWVEPNGRCDKSIAIKEDAFVFERLDGFPLRRLLHRYEATMRRSGGSDAMAALVRSRGRTCRDGWVVLEAEDRDND